MTEENTRPVSVAELLARNGTIGSPPVGGHRRRKRRNALSVAELTGEIPVIRTGEIPVVVDEPAEADERESLHEALVEETSETVVFYSSSDQSGIHVEETPVDDVPDYSDHHDYTPGYDEYAPGHEETPPNEEPAADVEDVSYDDAVGDDDAAGQFERVSYAEPETLEYEAEPESGVTLEPPAETEVVVIDEAVELRTGPRIEASRPPLSSAPLPERRRGPERSHDPRPRRRSTGSVPARRSSGAEQMSPDPVDEAVDLAELVAEQSPGPDLRSYLKSSTATLFFGETVADDLARRGEVSESGHSDADGGYGHAHGGYGYADDEFAAAGGEYDRDVVEEDADMPRRGALSVLGTSLVAVLQSLLAVVFGAGLFIGFDQLWRWNNIVALALSALVIAALMIGVHVVRKTEDFVSTLIAALVGILVTFGPLALQST